MNKEYSQYDNEIEIETEIDMLSDCIDGLTAALKEIYALRGEDEVISKIVNKALEEYTA